MVILAQKCLTEVEAAEAKMTFCVEHRRISGFGCGGSGCSPRMAVVVVVLVLVVVVVVVFCFDSYHIKIPCDQYYPKSQADDTDIHTNT